MHILWLNPYHGGSHAAVAEGYAQHSRHTVTLLTLPPPGGWRWRMRGAAITFARMVRTLASPPDVLVTTDMLDLATFRALSRDCCPPWLPMALYFHENQLTYPLPAERRRDMSFGWINYTSALTADRILFNSAFHQRSFLEALPPMLTRQHDYPEIEQIAPIAAKSSVLPPGIDLASLQPAAHEQPRRPPGPPILLWNSRWEYDKQPDAFFTALAALEARGIDFRLIVAGEHIDPTAPEFVTAYKRWQHRVLHWGYAPDRASYRRLLWHADIVVSTAIQEFFGIGIMEALFCGCVPVLPRRLSYPELLPSATHADCLYDGPADLVDRLQQSIQDLAQLRQYDWQALAQPYAWSHMAPRYDAAFAAMVPPCSPR
ncbi:MAG: DUF3524 domain-containing protein [Chloroflexaceae bacterium]|nr:DUF3524 domain-containing protein [Chloroflexaceae bacterium]